MLPVAYTWSQIPQDGPGCSLVWPVATAGNHCSQLVNNSPAGGHHVSTVDTVAEAIAAMFITPNEREFDLGQCEISFRF